MQILENRDIRLRALEPTDLKTLYNWENDSEIWQVSNTIAPFSLYILKQYLENSHLDIFQSKQLRLLIELKEGNRAIGLIDLFDFDPYHHRAGVGILIHKQSYRGHGYAAQALQTMCNYSFEVLQLHQLYCNVTSDNEASLRLFFNQGFEQTGNKKEWIKTPKGYIDEYLLQYLGHK